MTAVLLQPHSDDCALFASFLAIRHQPHVVTVLRSVKQEAYGVTDNGRAYEDWEAFQLLGLASREWWDFSDDDPDWNAITVKIQELPATYDLVIAPAYEPNGQHQHNQVGAIAKQTFREATIGYLTYTTGGVRSTWGTPVEFEPEWVFRKLAALSCYRSQARTPSVKHFLEPLAEYVA